MGVGMTLAMLSITLMYSLGLNLFFFIKKHVDTQETKLFSLLMLSNLVGIALEIACVLTIKYLGADNIYTLLVNKVFLIYHLLFTLLIFVYSVSVIFKKNPFGSNEKIGKLVMVSVFAILSLLVFILDTNISYTDKGTYSFGPSVNLVYGVVTVFFVLMILILIKNHRVFKEDKKRIFTLLSFIIGMSIVSFIQRISPTLVLSTEMETFLVFMMFNTIENPDVKMLGEVSAAKDQAEKANHAKSDFLSSMSHEIRTPLNAIVGFSECILNADTLEEAKEDASDIVSASNTLLEIVNGILDISKIESGKLELVEIDYDINKMLHDIVKLIQARIGDKPLDFQVNIAQDLPKTLYGDKSNFSKILVNFLTNAVKYTDAGFVRFDVSGVKVNNDMYRLFISVKDSGRGIKKEDMDKLFTKFQRLDEDRNTTIEGTGLGLAITKQLIEMMNGKLVVNSVYGEGSEFKVAIDQKISKKVVEEEASAEFIEFDLTGKNILVVDDNRLNLKVASKLLAAYNCNITTADSGEECIELYRNGGNFDLILLDDMMPKMRGSETLSNLRRIVGFNIPTVALTANAIQGMREQYLSLGFNDYLAKPIDKLELNRVLKKFIIDRVNNTVPSINVEVTNNTVQTPVVTEEPKTEPQVTEPVEQTPAEPIKEAVVVENNAEGINSSIENEILKTLGVSNNSEPVEEKKEETPKGEVNTVSYGIDPTIQETILKTLGVDAPVGVPTETPTPETTVEETPAETKPSPSVTRDYSNKKVLIVDDNKLNIKVAKKIMADFNFMFDECYSGEECIENCKKQKYDLIFMDYMMPHMDGIETFNKLKEDPEFNTPVIALTADAVVGAREKFMDAGFNEYISKPIDKALLAEAINKVLK